MILARYEGRWARILEATLALGLIAYFGRPVLVPIAVALVLTVLLMPVVGALEDVNPVAVLLGLLVLCFLWGIAGALLAVPFLVATRAVAEHHARGEKVAMLLGR